MKISVVNGSPRKNGATAKVLKEVCRLLKEHEDVEIDYYDLSVIETKFCMGCSKCFANGKCIIKNDNIEKISESIKKGDGVIFGTPTHGSNISALLKNFIDRGHFIVEQSLYNKKCMSVSTYEIADGISALKYLNKHFRVSGGHIAAKILVKTGLNIDPLNSKLNSQIKKETNKLYNSIIKNHKKSIFEYIFNDIVVVNLVWRPYFKKNHLQYKGVIERYIKAGIHKSLTNSINKNK